MHLLFRNKILIVIFLCVGLSGGAIGGSLIKAKHHIIPSQQAISSIPATQVLGQQTVSLHTKLPNPSDTLTPAFAHVIHAGVSSFAIYTASASGLWEITTEHDEKIGIDRLILSQQNYQLSIYQATSSVSRPCQDTGTVTMGHPSVLFAGTNGMQFERIYAQSGKTDQWQTFTLCQKKDVFVDVTTFGKINYIVPKNYKEDMLSQMDKIVASLKEQ